MQEGGLDSLGERIAKSIGETDDSISAQCDKSILVDPTSLKKLADSDGVIFVEKLKASMFDDIAKEIEIARNYGTNILGVVVVE